MILVFRKTNFYDSWMKRNSNLKLNRLMTWNESREGYATNIFFSDRIFFSSVHRTMKVIRLSLKLKINSKLK